MFVDEASVYLKSGKGGDGCLSFCREKYRPKGGPDGGNGGVGGDLILECNVQLADLTPYKYKPHAEAKNGQPGQGRNKHGKNGADCTLPVPAGTLVIDTQTDLTVAELIENGQKVILLKGGKGGKGNACFKSSTNRAPRRTTPGQPAEEGRFLLVLKTIADVGLVGYPNAGKSSLTNALTRAHPKIASYPFTTLQPSVGILESTAKKVTLADIPGLIEGASQNKGLGHRFLRHIERCKLLLFVLDTAGTDDRKPWEDMHSLFDELRLYGSNLLEKPRIILANKIDVETAKENLTELKKRFPGEMIIQSSCTSGEGLEELKDILTQRFEQKII